MPVRSKLIILYALLVSGNLFAWAWAFVALHDYPVFLGTAVLAYIFGLRYAVDADHIAAIDNITRKLMQEGQRPVAVGFFFSLGHSTVVVIASAAIALATGALQDRFASFKAVGGVIGTLVSASFLFLVAAANLLILRSVYRSFREVRHGGTYAEEDLNKLLEQRGLLGRFFRPIFRLVSRSCTRLECFSGLASIPLLKLGCWEFQRPKRQKAFQSGQLWFLPLCLRRACRWSIRRTAL